MEAPLPKEVNDRRRKSVTKYTSLAILVYHIPVLTAYLAKLIGLANYGYVGINYVYLAILVTGGLSLLFIRVKRQVTVRFVTFILYFQIVLCTFIITFKFYVMNDLRILTLIASMLALIFVFIQAKLLISFVIIGIVAVIYLTVSYVGITWMGQIGPFGKEFMTILVFLPVSVFIAYMCGILQKQQKEIRRSRDKLKETYAELETTHSRLESFNERMLESLYYAEMIQRSLLPGIDRMKTASPDSLIIWMPKDIVGGDIFYTYTDGGKSIIALMDCTGHGVPGAFLTMIAYSEIRKIIMDEMCHDPSEILARLNRSVKMVLHKDISKSATDDGLDAAICHVDHEQKQVIFAGASMSLIYMSNGSAVSLKGDKNSIGYKDSDDSLTFTNHIITSGESDCFYMKSDGYTDQLGGKRRRRFGKKQFRDMVEEHYHKPFDEQRKILIRALMEYQGENEQIDDITVIGFRL